MPWSVHNLLSTAFVPLLFIRTPLLEKSLLRYQIPSSIILFFKIPLFLYPQHFFLFPISTFLPSFAMFIHVNIFASIHSSSKMHLNICYSIILFRIFLCYKIQTVSLSFATVQKLHLILNICQNNCIFWTSSSLLGNKNYLLKSLWGYFHQSVIFDGDH